MATIDPVSPRLRYRRLTARDADRLHGLAIDPHVRRYLLDDEVVAPGWAEAEIRRSEELFARRGVGLWLVTESQRPGPAIGFGGFRVFDELGPDPQLLYALLEPATGRGYATEIARALAGHAVAVAGLREVTAAVDAPNTASIRVLEKAGFRRTGDLPGPFGRTLCFVWPGATP